MIRLQNVLKMSSRCLEEVLKTYGQDKYIDLDQDVLKKSSEDVWLIRIYSSSSRRLEDVFWRRRRKTPSRRLHQDECLPGWLFPFLGHFCMPWELLHLISKYFLFVSLFIWLCIEIKLNGTCIFLLARPFIKQSRDLIG